MIIIYCEAAIAPEKQAEFIEKVNAAGIIKATNQEPGNISYELLCPTDAPGKMFIIERWESREVLPAHMQGANFQALGKLSAEYGVKSTLKLYSAEALN